MVIDLTRGAGNLKAGRSPHEGLSPGYRDRVDLRSPRGAACNGEYRKPMRDARPERHNPGFTNKGDYR